MLNMSRSKPTEKDYYLPILDTLRSFGGTADLDEIRLAVRPFLRAESKYLEEPAGPKTKETRYHEPLLDIPIEVSAFERPRSLSTVPLGASSP